MNMCLLSTTPAKTKRIKTYSNCAKKKRTIQLKIEGKAKKIEAFVYIPHGSKQNGKNRLCKLSERRSGGKEVEG